MSSIEPELSVAAPMRLLLTDRFDMGGRARFEHSPRAARIVTVKDD